MDFCYHCKSVDEIAKKVNKRGTVAWQSPSNIALIKYWGKKGFQIPANASLSMTLSEAVTRTSVDFRPCEEPGEISFNFYFDGKESPAFSAKIHGFLEKIVPEMPFLKKYHFEIQSYNTFPHSAGIASSASAMSALALCLCTIEKQINNQSADFDEAFFVRASHFARIGSGSAARSLFGGFVSWGKTDAISGSADEFAAKIIGDFHPVFRNMKDTILLISKGEKKVSSRAGHGLMENHPYSVSRYAHAEQNLTQIISALKSGDMEAFISIVENEALTLHAMMMASNPGFILMEPATMLAIERIRNYRQRTDTPVCFTLDAGPNIHLLYPEIADAEVKLFIQNELIALCDNNQLIDDKIGDGPKNLTTNEKK